MVPHRPILFTQPRPSPNQLAHYAARSRFVEGSMNDRASTAPPLRFLVGGDGRLFETLAQEAQAYEKHGAAVAETDKGQHQNGSKRGDARQPQPASSVENMTMGMKKSFLGPLLDGVREKLHLARSRSSNSIATTGHGKDKAAAQQQEEDEKKKVPAKPLPAGQYPSREEVLESYRNLVASGFFSDHAIHGSRHNRPSSFAAHGARAAGNGMAPLSCPVSPPTHARQPRKASFAEHCRTFAASEQHQYQEQTTTQSPPPDALPMPTYAPPPPPVLPGAYYSSHVAAADTLGHQLPDDSDTCKNENAVADDMEMTGVSNNVKCKIGNKLVKQLRKTRSWRASQDERSRPVAVIDQGKDKTQGDTPGTEDDKVSTPRSKRSSQKPKRAPVIAPRSSSLAKNSTTSVSASTRTKAWRVPGVAPADAAPALHMSTTPAKPLARLSKQLKLMQHRENRQQRRSSSRIRERITRDEERRSQSPTAFLTDSLGRSSRRRSSSRGGGICAPSARLGRRCAEAPGPVPTISMPVAAAAFDSPVVVRQATGAVPCFHYPTRMCVRQYVRDLNNRAAVSVSISAGGGDLAKVPDAHHAVLCALSIPDPYHGGGSGTWERRMNMTQRPHQHGQQQRQQYGYGEVHQENGNRDKRASVDSGVAGTSRHSEETRMPPTAGGPFFALRGGVAEARTGIWR